MCEICYVEKKCKYTDKATGVYDGCVFRYCHNVQFLSLAYCKKFSDRGLQYLSAGKCSKKLEYLDLSGCLQVRVSRSVSNNLDLYIQQSE